MIKLQQMRPIFCGLLLILNFSSCSAESTFHPKTNDFGHLSLTQSDRSAFINMTEELLERYPYDKFNYVIIGRSLTPIFAILSYLSLAKPELQVRSFPLSSAGSLEDLLTFQKFDEDFNRTFYLKKLFDHYDVYLGPLLERMFLEENPRKILLIDYVQTGHSLGMTKLTVDWYLRFKIASDPSLKSKLDKVSQFPLMTEYFGILDPIFGKSKEIESNINSFKRLYQAKISGTRNLEMVEPKSILGTEAIEVDIDEIERTLNLKTKGEEWHWAGQVMVLGSEYEDQLELLGTQAFDRYAPYGSWDLFYGELEEKLPQFSSGFIEFRQKLIACDLKDEYSRISIDHVL